MARNIGEQLVQIIFETHDPEFVPVLEGGFENAVGDQFCDRIDHAHIQLERRARFAAFHTLGQFGAESENLVRILVNDLTRLGQAQATADPLEQRFVDRFAFFGHLRLGDVAGQVLQLPGGVLEQLELAADRLRRDKQCFGRFGDAAFTRDGPEYRAGGCSSDAACRSPGSGPDRFVTRAIMRSASYSGKTK